MKRTIWIDQDSVLYDLHTPWLRMHNDEYPDHIATIEDHTSWDVDKACKAVGCPGNMRKYFDAPELWTEGIPIKDSQRVVFKWSQNKNIEVGVLTTAANGMCMPYKLAWLSGYYPYIKNVIMVNTHLKHMVRGDILIDDGLHNLEDWQGVGICYTQPWNKDVEVLRAHNWSDVDKLVERALAMLNDGDNHDQVQEYLEFEQYVPEMLA